MTLISAMDGWFGGWFTASGGPPPHPRLTRISRWTTPHPWDSLVAAMCSYFCFLGPFIILIVALLPFFLLLPLLVVWWLTLEAVWLLPRWHLRTVGLGHSRASDGLRGHTGRRQFAFSLQNRWKVCASYVSANQLSANPTECQPYRKVHEPWTDVPAFPKRREHLERFLKLKDDAIPCIKAYLSEWFRGAPPELIKTENAREFFRYGFYGSIHTGPLSTAEEEEIQWLIRAVEKAWDVRFEPGRTEGLTFMAHMVRIAGWQFFWCA